MDEDDFIFMTGSLKIDTIKSGDRQVLSLTIFQKEIFPFHDANEFNFTIKITDTSDILCFTTFKNSEEKSGDKKTYFPVDPAHFYEVGKLIDR